MRRLLLGPSGVALEASALVLLATAVADGLGAASVSFNVLVAGVPVCATVALVCFAEAVDAASAGDRSALARLQTGLGALLLATVVLGAAVRAPAVGAASIPWLASTALAVGLLLLALQAVVALAPALREIAGRSRAEATAPDAG